MKRNLKNSLYLVCTVLFLLISQSCNQKENKSSEHVHSEEYTCPMHPQVVQKEPGTCPVCGMDLVKKSGHQASLEITEGIDHLTKSTNSVAVSSIKTITPVQKTMEIFFNANGIIAYDTRQSTTIPIRFAGRIEKLFIRYNFQPVKKGQKIMEVYSPDLLTAQKELLFLIKSDPDNSALIEASTQKLRLIGVTENQIDQLIKTGKEIYSFAVYSPYTGYITEESTANVASPTPAAAINASANPAGMDGMGATANVALPATSATSSSLSIREGMYLNAGQTVFRIINPNKVWAEFNIYQKDAAFIKANDPITIRLNQSSEDVIQAKVSFVQPFFEAGESFSRIRVYLSNKNGELKVGTLATATFKNTAPNATWIPTSSVVDLGNKSVVFKKNKEVFAAHQITTGRKAANYIEVVEGLETSDQIAIDGQFLVDSESFIRVE